MLNFFRKYQKIFFIFITIMVVISFVFFGTFSTFAAHEEMPERHIATAWDGSSITSTDIELMNRFLKDGAKEGGRAVNFLNGSIVHHDFLESGLATLLVERYWTDIKSDLESRFRKAKHFTSYAHPQVPFLSAKIVWEGYCPEMNELLEELKKTEGEVSPNHFSLLLKLYLAQTKLPPQLLKEILLRQQNQYSWIKPDPLLFHEDLSLFGFHSVEDWFGSKLMSLISQFIINASLYAEEKGFHPSKEEARADLLLNVQEGAQLYAQDKKVSLEEAQGYYYQMIQSLGTDESKAIVLWKKVLGFKHLFQEAARAVFLDSLALKQFHEFSRDCAQVALYQLPEALRFSDFPSLMKFQLYLESVSADKWDESCLPKNFLPLSTIEKNTPQLVQEKFQLKVAQVTQDELMQKISLKQAWEWELEADHFADLQKAFPALALETGNKREDRFAALEKLESKERFKVDQAARKAILDLHLQWVDEALDKAAFHDEEVAIKKEVQSFPIDGVTDILEFGKLLEKEDPRLHHFTANEETYYRIQVMQKPKGKEILTFSSALQDGTLDLLLDQKLEAAYPAIRKKAPTEFLREDNNWKQFEQVKEQIGAHLYSKLFNNFKQKKRFWDFMESAKAEYKQGHREYAEKTIGKQWELVKSEISLKRKKQMDPLLEEAFQLKEGDFSIVHSQEDGAVCFFQLLERKQEKESSLEEVEEAQKALARDAQKKLMNQILNLFFERKLISLSHHETE